MPKYEQKNNGSEKTERTCPSARTLGFLSECRQREEAIKKELHEQPLSWKLACQSYDIRFIQAKKVKENPDEQSTISSLTIV